MSRRRRHPTTAAPPRWTRPFRRDSGAAPRQGAKTCAAIGFRPAGKRGAASESMPGEARANRTGRVSVRLAIRASPGAIITRCSERPMAAHVLAATPPLLQPRLFAKVAPVQKLFPTSQLRRPLRLGPPNSRALALTPLGLFLSPRWELLHFLRRNAN